MHLVPIWVYCTAEETNAGNNKSKNSKFIFSKKQNKTTQSLGTLLSSNHRGGSNPEPPDKVR